jgi:hypothetical protein
MNANFSRFASRPVGVAHAVKISFCIVGVGLSLCVGKALLTYGLTTGAMARTLTTQPMATIIDEPTNNICHDVSVEIDDGYGVRGHVTRHVCGKVF